MFRVCIASIYTIMVWLPDGEKKSNIRLFVLTWSTNVKKNRRFHVPQPTFLFPLRLSCCMDERQFNACQTPRSMYLSIFNSFRVIRCLIQCVSPKIAIFYHIFVSPGDAAGAITLSVVVMERDGPVLSMSCPVLVILFSGSRPDCTPGWILYTSLFTI